MSYNANINVCMLVNCFCTVGGCAITGGYAGGEGDCDGDVCGCDSAGECEAAAWVSVTFHTRNSEELHRK